MDAVKFLENPRSIDLGKITQSVLSTMPWFAKPVVTSLIGFITPFNRSLGLVINRWDKRSCEAEVKIKRRLRNHLGVMHAGALSTIGETVAGLVIVRNLNISKFKLLIKEVNCVCLAPARSKVIAVSELDPDAFVKLKEVLATKQRANVKMQTHITNEKGDAVATVKTIWTVEPWKYEI